MARVAFSRFRSTTYEKLCRCCFLLSLSVLFVLLFLPVRAYSAHLAGGQRAAATLKGDATYIGRTVWADAKSLAWAPLEIRKVREITLRQVLIGALVAGGIGALIALDEDIRAGAKDIDNSTADALQSSGIALSWAGLVTLYGVGWWKDETQWRHEALTGAESALVSFGLVRLMKVSFGRERPDARKGATAWFEGGTSFVSDAATPPFALAEAMSGAFDHTWWVTLPTYAAATAAGVGRMGKDRHWASDIVASALLGVGTAKLLAYMHHRREQAAQRVTFFPIVGDTVGFRLAFRF